LYRILKIIVYVRGILQKVSHLKCKKEMEEREEREEKATVGKYDLRHVE
jgi:hypothetical protein